MGDDSPSTIAARAAHLMANNPMLNKIDHGLLIGFRYSPSPGAIAKERQVTRMSALIDCYSALRTLTRHAEDVAEFLERGIDPTEESEVKAVLLRAAAQDARDAMKKSSEVIENGTA